MRRTSIGKVYLRSGEREQISNAHWVRSSLMKVAISSLRKDRRSKLAGLCALLAVMSGCQRNAQIPSKSPVPVRLAEVSSYASPEGLRYSASIVPFAQAALSFKSSGYVTDIQQVVGADGRRRDVGTGDYVVRGAVLARIRQQDLKNQLDQAEDRKSTRLNSSHQIISYAVFCLKKKKKKQRKMD